MILVAAIALPLIAGALLPALRLKQGARLAYMLGVTLVTSALVGVLLFSPEVERLDLIRFNEFLVVSLHLDGMGKVFAALAAFLWPLATLYASEYMQLHRNQESFFAFYTMSYGITLGVAMSANLLTLYIFYEMMTLSTLPLVLHGGSPRAISAGLKYLYYSLGGAAFAFMGMVYVLYFGGTTDFQWGGLFQHIARPHTAQLQLGYLFCFLGFGVKAAVFPVHGWLVPASVAPTPVTALLHAVAVVKAGVFSVMRATYFSFGVSILAGSYAQYIPLALAAFTIVYGSTLALKEKHLKRRLAYSTIANLSYILFGVLLMTPAGLAAGLLHMVFHALIKITLFLAAGAYMEKCHLESIQDLRGLGKNMPLTSLVFVIGGLALTGIPPLLGFVSKWALASSAVAQGGLLPYLGVAALIISAILTGTYMMVPSFMLYTGKRPPGAPEITPMGLPFQLTLIVLGLSLLVFSFWNGPLIDFLTRAASGLA